MNLPPETEEAVHEIAEFIGMSDEAVAVRLIEVGLQRLRKPQPTQEGTEIRLREIAARVLLDPRAVVPLEELMLLLGWRPVT